ncbi:MAG: radical SAM protein, partial [Candidatus Omnitrophica bacterium]|nr:radical SAM protein [Candidatus Omnitrophota bacterium]
VLTPSAKVSHMIARSIKEKEADVKIVFGGVHPSVLTAVTLEDSAVDFVISGEGEIAMKELIDALEGKRDLRSVDGLSFREDGKVHHNPIREFINNLDELGKPDWTPFPPISQYKPLPHWHLKQPSLPMLTSRGCPFRCTFCCVNVSGGTYRARSAKFVVDEIEEAVNRFGVKQISFFDPAFPMNKKIAKDICEEIIKRELHRKIVWMTESRIDCVDKELLSLMKESGCRRLAFGIESGNQKILDSIRKKITLEQVRETIKNVKEAGIEIIAYFIIGFPEDTINTVNETIEFAKELDTDYVKFNIAVPYPGTEMYDYAVKTGRLRTRDWDIYTSFSSMTNYDPVFTPENIDVETLKKMQRKAFRSYYFRPRMILKHIKKLRSPYIFGEYINSAFTMLKSLRGEV